MIVLQRERERESERAREREREREREIPGFHAVDLYITKKG